LRAIAHVSSGIESSKVDGSARDVINKAGYGKFFGHGTGHGIGLQVHELPRITQNVKEVIKENMVFTIEPGIYLPGIGGVRIEDMVLVKSDGSEVLTRLPKKLEIIR
jgi:Xaa-Pro aminopeptidase